jgi:hypothetical protein
VDSINKKIADIEEYIIEVKANNTELKEKLNKILNALEAKTIDTSNMSEM